MAFTKLTTDMNYISALPDAPSDAGMSAAELKAEFDKAGNTVKTYISGLIDEISSSAAAGNIGVAAIDGISGSTVQAAMESLKNAIDDIVSASVPDDSITTAKLAALAVTTAKLAELAVTADKLANGAVTEDKLAINSVATAKVQDGAITAAKLAAGSVTGEKLGSKAVAAANIADETIGAGQISRNSISGSRLATSCIGTSHIVSGAVTGAKLNLQNNDLPWAKLTYGVHYFNSTDTLPTATAGRLIFVKRG